METTYINSFDNFISEDNHILVEDDALQNANHILILMNSVRNFGLLCVSKPTENSSGNEARMEKLQKDLVQLNCSFIPFKFGLNYTSAADSIVRNEDDCLFIQGIELEELLTLAAKYEQQTAVYGNRDELKSYDVQSGEPDVMLGAVDMKLAMAMVLFHPVTFR